MFDRRAGPFQHAHRAAIGEQPLHEMRPQKARAAGDEIHDRVPVGNVSAICLNRSRAGESRSLTILSMSANAARFKGHGNCPASRIK
jgi:hypothetical protein